jgi:hypothetical protein
MGHRFLAEYYSGGLIRYVISIRSSSKVPGYLGAP